MDQEPQCVFVASGELHADQVRGFLDSAGIATIVRGESLRQTHGLTIDGLGAVEILVADADAEQARALLAEAETGRLRLGDDADVRGKDPPTSIAEE
ncbi:MAG: DUF2007 domain-containing protein [Acidobacteriota bacterium]